MGSSQNTKQVLILALRAIYLIYFHPLSHHPGPKLWAISRIPWAYHVLRGDLWHAMDHLHDIYGPVVRVAPDELTFISPQVWQDVYALSKTRPQLDKDPRAQLKPLIPGADSLFTAQGDDHRRIKGVFVGAFADKSLRDQTENIHETSTSFIQRLRHEMVKGGGVVDLHRILGYAAFDLGADFTRGESPKTLEKPNEHHEYIRNFFMHATVGTTKTCLDRYWPLGQLLLGWITWATAKQRKANAKDSWERMERRLAMETVRSDFITPVADKISETGTKGTMTKSEVLVNQLAVLVAHSQLTTIGLSTAAFLLARERIQFGRLAREVRETFSHESEITVTSTKSLVYLDAVLNEALRINHPTPSSMPRIVPPEGLVVAGHFIPAGNIVGLSLYNMHTRPENFYAPREFHPERFLDESHPYYDARFANDKMDAFKPFSVGPRGCLGNRQVFQQFLLERT